MTFKKLMAFFAPLLVSSLAFAQGATTGEAQTSTALSTTRDASGRLPGLGIAFGHLDQGGNTGADGQGASVQLLGTYYFPTVPWIADAGVGFHQQYLSGDGSDPFVGLVSASARYRLPQRYSFGPIVTGFIGDGEPFGTADNYLIMAGIVGFKEILVQNDQLVRLGLRYTSGVFNSGQTNTFIGLAAEWAVGSQNPVVERYASN